MKSPGKLRWREWLVLAGVPGTVALAWGLGQVGVPRLLGDRWLLDWGIGTFYAVGVLCPLGWYRSQSWFRILCAVTLSVLAWHWTVQIASDGYDGTIPSHNRFFLRSSFAGFFGAVLVGAAPLGRSIYPNWERRLAGIGVVGGICGGQMALFCIWNFEIGFWLGMVGWQLAVTLMLIHGTAPYRRGKLVFWPAPPQLN